MQLGSSQWRLWLSSWKGLSDPDAIIECIERAEAKSKSTSKAADVSIRSTRASQGQAGESPASTQVIAGESEQQIPRRSRRWSRLRSARNDKLI
jgi:hypothetical protein